MIGWFVGVTNISLYHSDGQSIDVDETDDQLRNDEGMQRKRLANCPSMSRPDKISSMQT